MAHHSNPGLVLLIGPRSPALSCRVFVPLAVYLVPHLDPGFVAEVHCSFVSALFLPCSSHLFVSASRYADRLGGLYLTAETV